MKANLVKLITLEQQMASERLERQKAENEFNLEREKLKAELKVIGGGL